MANFSIGPSSYGDLRGVIQYVNTQRIADQFNSLVLEYNTQVAKNGDRLSANEGMRSRPRQSLLYANFLRTGYPKAANPFTSRHDEVTHGNAIDVGVTMANGDNRALTPAEFNWLHAQCEKRGFTWTGRNFNEPWHIEGATRLEVLPPYPSSPSVPAETHEPTTTTTPVGDIVNTRIKRVKYPHVEFRSYLVNVEEFKAMPLVTKDQETYWNNAGVPLDKDVQPAWILTNFEIISGKGVY